MRICPLLWFAVFCTAAKPVASAPCFTCVRWEIPPLTTDSRNYRFSDGTRVILNDHGIRYPTAERAPAAFPFMSRPVAVAELSYRRIAWMDSEGTTSVTATPLGATIAVNPPPRFSTGERVAAVFTNGEVLFVFGSQTAGFRSVDGGENWLPLNLGVPPFARFRAVGMTQSGREIEIDYFPMWYATSEDAGVTWARRPATRTGLYDPVTAGRDPRKWDSCMTPESPDLERTEGKLLIAGDVLLRARGVNNAPIAISTASLGGTEHAAPLRGAARPTEELGLVGGEGSDVVLAFRDVDKVVPYRRGKSTTTFSPLAPLAIPKESDGTYRPSAVAVGDQGATYVGVTSTALATLAEWSGAGAPKVRVVVSPLDARGFVIDARHQTVWRFGPNSRPYLGRWDATLSDIRLVPVRNWDEVVAPLGLSAGERLAESAAFVDELGTLRVLIKVRERAGAYLLRVGRDGVALPLLRVPFHFDAASAHELEFAFAGKRGYSSRGWETADGGEHWTRVDAYPGAKTVACTKDGCLVDRAQRIGWVLPQGWAEGEAAVPVKPKLDALATAANAAVYDCVPLGPPQISRVRGQAHCLPARTDRVQWALVDARNDGAVLLQMALPRGQSQQRLLLEANGSRWKLDTAYGCDERGAFAIRDPFPKAQRLLERDGVQPPKWTEPCVAGSYVRFSDGKSHQFTLSCAESPPWRFAYSGAPSVAVTEKGIFLGTDRQSSDDEKPVWWLVSDGGKKQEIPLPPTWQRALSVLEHGGQLDVLSRVSSFKEPHPSVVAHFDGKAWRESFWDVPGGSSLQLRQGRPVITLWDLPSDWSRGAPNHPIETAAGYGPVGYFPLDEPTTMPNLRAWPNASSRPCVAADLNQPSAMALSAEPVAIHFKLEGTQLDFPHAARRLRYLDDGSSCTEVILASQTPPLFIESARLFNFQGVWLSPQDPKHAWFHSADTALLGPAFAKVQRLTHSAQAFIQPLECRAR